MIKLEQKNQNERNRNKHGGSRPGPAQNFCRDFEGGYEQLFRDYFADPPIYAEYYFRRQFCKSRALFLKIAAKVEAHDQYSVQKLDAVGHWGLYPLQKITSALRILAYGNAADANDKYLWIGELTSHESLDHFCDAIINLYSTEYLQAPNENKIKKLLALGKERKFPGMLGSLDCMHWEWKNCPTGWAGQYQGKEKVRCNSSSYHIVVC
jgi:hypothetical protein